MSLPSLDVAIFSYNRGAYLKNCVDSLQRNMPWIGWTVYDDGSDEPDTVAYLQSLSHKKTCQGFTRYSIKVRQRCSSAPCF